MGFRLVQIPAEMGLESFDGRGPVRKSAGTTRPPTIPPEVWQSYSPDNKAEAIKEYIAQLASDAAAFGGVAAPATGVTSESSGSPRQRLWIRSHLVPPIGRHILFTMTIFLGSQESLRP